MSPQTRGAKKNSMQTVDADGHVIERPEIWQEYIDPKFRDRVPEIVTLSDGSKWVSERDYSLDRTAAQLTPYHERGAPPDTSQPSEWAEEARTKMSLPGGYDPHARIKDMDADGIDIVVNYPTRLLGWYPDPRFFNALCQAYNNWLADYSNAYPKRLYGAGLVPLQDIELAIKEMRRCVKDLGFKAVMIRPCPYIGERKLYDEVYDPFWAEAQELDCPIGIHPAPFGDMPNVVRGLRLDEGHRHVGEGLFLKQGMSLCLDMMVATAWFVGGGILEKFPRLKVVIIEGSGGWIVTWLERLDHHYEIFGGPWQKHLPSELFDRSCYISFDPDEKMLEPTVKILGPEKIVWASDYPHPDAKIPGVVDELFEAIAGLPEKEQRLIAGENALKLYNIG